MNFQTKSDLTSQTLQELERIIAINSALRTTEETKFYNARLPYLTNEVISEDADGLILQAAGNTLPTGLTGFKKGALFIKKDAATTGLYQNIGDQTSASWSLITDTDTDNNLLTESTPVNAVAAAKVLTVGGIPAEDDSVTIGDQVYTFKDTIGTAVAAGGVLTFGANAGNDKVVVIGNKTYTFKTNLTEVKATGTLTATANPQDGARVTIGSTVYTFRDTLANAFDVLIGATAEASLDNLIAAINLAAGAGSTYGTGTTVHPTVTAVAGAGDTVTITAKTVGVAGNAIATVDYSPGLAFGAGTLGSGVDAIANEIKISAVNASGSLDNLIAAINGAAGVGTTYSTGTVASTQVTVAAGDGDIMAVTAITAGDEGNLIATTTDIVDASWANTTLTGGEGVEEAYDVLIGVSAEASIDNLVAAINGAEGAGTTYGTGTVAHPSVLAAKANASTMSATAKVKGVAGNSIAIAEDGDDLSWAAGATALTGGINGVVGAKGQLYFDTSFIYLATAANTIADANWKKASIATL